MLNSGLAIHAKNAVHEHTKRGVVAQVLFCESSQSVTTKGSIPKSVYLCYFKSLRSNLFEQRKQDKCYSAYGNNIQYIK